MKIMDIHPQKIHLRTFAHRNLCTQFQELHCLPQTYLLIQQLCVSLDSLQNQNPQKQKHFTDTGTGSCDHGAQEVTRSSADRLVTQESQGANCSPRWNPRAGEDQCPSLKTGREKEFCLTPLQCSIQAFIGINEAHPHREGSSALLRPWIQMLISPRNPLSATPE